MRVDFFSRFPFFQLIFQNACSVCSVRVLLSCSGAVSVRSFLLLYFVLARQHGQVNRLRHTTQVDTTYDTRTVQFDITYRKTSSTPRGVLFFQPTSRGELVNGIHTQGGRLKVQMYYNTENTDEA